MQRFVIHEWVRGGKQVRVQRGDATLMDQVKRLTACGLMADWASVTHNLAVVTCPACNATRARGGGRDPSPATPADA